MRLGSFSRNYACSLQFLFINLFIDKNYELIQAVTPACNGPDLTLPQEELWTHFRLCPIANAYSDIQAARFLE